MTENQTENQIIISPKNKYITTQQLPSLITTGIVILIIYAFASGAIYRFYANFVFLFYSFLKSMWLAVVCLGVWQTILLIPFRIVSLKTDAHINEFKEQLETGTKTDQRQLFASKYKEGSKSLLFYIVNFFLQITSYIAIGQLFLNDFYNTKIDSKLLYSFVPYPNYPIKDTFFKIPYPVVTQTTDLGFHLLIIFWIIIGGLKIITTLINNSKIISKQFSFASQQNDYIVSSIKTIYNLINRYFIILLILAWLLIRHYPAGWQIRIFSGDISKPFPTFNLITAIMTTLVIIWLETPKVLKKASFALASGVPANVVRKIERKLFSRTLKTAILLGLAAFFITNQIPCAFELSIFTFEVISWISPFTLDRLIFRISKPATSV